MLQKIILLYSIFLAHYITDSDLKSINDFKRNYFKLFSSNEGFEQVTTGLEGLTNYSVVFNGFLNRDLYTDIVLLSKDNKTLKFFSYNNDSSKFEEEISEFNSINGENILTIKTQQILSISSWPNIIIVSYITQSEQTKTILRGYEVKKENGKNILQQIEKYELIVEDNSDQQQEPFNFQIFKTNEIRNYWLMMSAGERTIYYWNNDSSSFESSPFLNILTKDCENCLEYSQLSLRKIPQIYGAAFIDINRDCKSDLILQSEENGKKYLEFYYYYENNFGFIKSVEIPSNYSIPSFEDINNNNLQDIVFYDSKEGKLKFFMNDLEEHISDITSTVCQDKFISYFPYSSLENPESKYAFDQEISENEGMLSESELRVFPMIRFGDLNLDGYRDIIMNVKKNDSYKVLIMKNSDCTEKQEPYTSSKAYCRYFDESFLEEQLKQLQDLKIHQTSFFDFGERGKLGFLVLHLNGSDYKINSYLNNIEIENYFLKAIGFLGNNSYYTLNGANFMIKKTELDGNYKVMTRTQTTNSQFNLFSLPFVHFGLGKINNYVEDFQVTIPRSSNSNYSWNPIIPNSQLIVYFSPGTSTEFDLNIFINPTSAMFFIFISTIIVLVVIGVIILILHSREKKIDERFQMMDFNLI